jgi:PTS system mannose-specific IIA component
MIGLVVVTHGRLAHEFLAATEHVVGPLEATRAICIDPDDDMDAKRTEIIEAVAHCDRGAGVVVLTDMFGGTPSNLAISTMGVGRIEVIAGANLPMLIKLAEVRERMGMSEAATAAAEAGHKYIRVVSQLLQKAE